MTISLYNNSSPHNSVTKELTAVATITGYLRDGTTIIDPAIMVEQASLPQFNYMIIPELERRYFVTNVSSVVTKLWTIRGHVDVLSTYWDSIKSSECIVSRNEYKRTADLVDPEVWVTADSLYGVRKFSAQPLMNTNTTNRFVAVLAGAGAS